ncbi:MAG: UPF0182 family protein [Egibacteraceae bacterium]
MTLRQELRRRWWLVLLAVVVLVLLFGTRISTFYTDALWYDSVGFGVVFWRLVGIKIGLGAVAGLGVALLLGGNLLLARRLAPPYRIPSQGEQAVERYRQTIEGAARPLLIGVGVAFGLLSGAAMLQQWKTFLLWVNAASFGIKDPQFGLDLGFFVFRLPFLELVNSWLFTALALTIVLTALAHYVYGGIRPQAPGQKITPLANVHLSVLLALLVAVRAWGFWLDRYLLSYSQRGGITGLSYTDVNAQLRAYQLLTVIAAVCVVLFCVNIRVRGWLLPSSGVAILLVAAVLLAGIYPAVIQRLQVAPQQLRREEQYITRNLRLTRFAYRIDGDHVSYEPFTAADELGADGVAANAKTLESVRLWDPTTLETVYDQVQTFRPFYDFRDVDTDRYLIDGEPRQVMVSVRELGSLTDKARTWQNQALTFTHGYGYVASGVSTAAPNGQPDFLVRDIPLDGVAAVKVDNPRVYFGEVGRQSPYSVIGTAQDEFDYPVGDKDATFRYDGKDGVLLSSPLRRVAFAFRFGEPNIVLSNLIGGDSRILLRRNVRERVRVAAPFLDWDDDPYPVAIDGRIKWIIDAYTTTDMVPYSERKDLADLTLSAQRILVRQQQPTGQIQLVPQVQLVPGLRGRANYIRNSVKAVVDAYDGTVSFYVTDPADPLIRAWGQAFPGILRPVEQAGAQLRAHFRYPEDLFTVQAAMLRAYHIQDAGPFFRGDDVWAIPKDLAFAENQEKASAGSDRQRDLPPTYQLLRLPGEQQEQFALVGPFTPAGRQNLSAYVAGTVDVDGKGRLRVLRMPPSKTVFGPEQVYARINQNIEVSKEITLLNQSGSQVIRGNLIVVPVADSLLYIEPLFLRGSQGSNIPELRRVVLVLGEKVVMGDRLDDALQLLFGQRVSGIQGPPAPGQPPVIGAASDPRVAALIRQALDAFAAADQALRGGDLGAYQLKTRAAQTALQQAQRLIERTPPAP